MTPEEKQLLLKDLCARLLYGLKISVDGYICTLLDINTEMGNKLNGETFHVAGFNKPNGDYNFCTISEVKPYLHPMSSMTEEEQKRFDDFCVIDEEAWKGNGVIGFINQAQIISEAIDFLNSHHFDYHGLIEKGLAIEAPEGMYNKVEI